MSQPIRILIAHHDINFSQSLQDFLAQQEDIKVVSATRDGQGAVDGCKETLPDLVLMDLRLPVLDSIRAIHAILAQNEQIKILTMSSVPNDKYAVEAIKAGACGYLEKNGDIDFEAVAEAIRQVARGEVLLNPILASSILDEFHRLTE